MFRTSLERRQIAVHKRSTLALALSALALIAGPSTYAAATSPDIVLYAAVVAPADYFEIAFRAPADTAYHVVALRNYGLGANAHLTDTVIFQKPVR